MVETLVYEVFDVRRVRVAEEFVVLSEADARREFAVWYQTLVRPGRWEARKLGRYFLLSRLCDDDGALLPVARRFVMSDEDVRLDYEYARFCSPPCDASAAAELDAWFERVDAADAARLAARGNKLLEFFNASDDGRGSETRAGVGVGVEAERS